MRNTKQPLFGGFPDKKFAKYLLTAALILPFFVNAQESMDTSAAPAMSDPALDGLPADSTATAQPAAPSTPAAELGETKKVSKKKTKKEAKKAKKAAKKAKKDSKKAKNGKKKKKKKKHS